MMMIIVDHNNITVYGVVTNLLLQFCIIRNVLYSLILILINKYTQCDTTW